MYFLIVNNVATISFLLISPSLRLHHLKLQFAFCCASAAELQRNSKRSSGLGITAHESSLRLMHVLVGVRLRVAVHL